MFTEMLGPVLDKYLNHYQQDIALKSPFRGQENLSHVFTLDYRNTADPQETADYEGLLFQFVGELFLNGQGCTEFSPIDFPALEVDESYVAITP